MPTVSVIVPTYNRSETILRCLESVRAQTFEDFELIVVDDGSTDDSAEKIRDFDPRLRLIQQENQGLTGARNTGLRAARGDYLSFLDSDDEWLPHHLELTLAYLRAHPQREFVSTEFWENFGGDNWTKHYQIEVGEWYPWLAERLGFGSFQLPAGETDNYMRVYEAREAIGPWGREIVEQAGHPEAQLYTGNIFDKWRWGYLMAMQPTVLTRAAFERVGFFDMKYVIVSDHGFIASLCQHFEASFLSLPTAIKHEYNDEGEIPSEDHLATGKHRLAGADEMVRWLEDQHLSEAPEDPELRAIRAYRSFFHARQLSEDGERDAARTALIGVTKDFPGLWEARLLSASLALFASPKLRQQVFDLAMRVSGRLQRIRS